MKRAVFVCPGRGSYNAAELGSLSRYFPSKDLLAKFDDIRLAAGQPAVTSLDQAQSFEVERHATGNNASALIFAAGLGDRLCLDPTKIELVAVTGNSMGWYTALAAAGAVTPETGFEIANTMGRLMHENGVGGQLIYPHMGDNWTPDSNTEKDKLLALVAEIGSRRDHRLELSIDLGGALVLAGNSAGLSAFEAAVPRVGRFPLRLAHHAAFHTDLMTPISNEGLAVFGTERFGQPARPMIDGRGLIWWPGATDVQQLRDYTLRTQVTEPYSLTRAIQIAAREFAPDLFILAGPGDTLGGAIVQSLILDGWQGLHGKSAFQDRQAKEPVLVSMGRSGQRRLVASDGLQE